MLAPTKQGNLTDFGSMSEKDKKVMKWASSGSSIGFAGGLYYAFRQKKGFWGYVGYGLLFSLIGGAVTGVPAKLLIKDGKKEGDKKPTNTTDKTPLTGGSLKNIIDNATKKTEDTKVAPIVTNPKVEAFYALLRKAVKVSYKYGDNKISHISQLPSTEITRLKNRFVDHVAKAEYEAINEYFDTFNGNESQTLNKMGDAKAKLMKKGIDSIFYNALR